ncbi:hypothetical protein AB0I95_15020 [Micromonospora sp. NPDC049751]|uniref:hypothetical protein n=1 Tax=Micromonospora sp. NPDC049751 TaxID=3154837 RepID=UPI0033C21AE8
MGEQMSRQDTEREFENMMIRNELVTPSQVGQGLGKFAANARRLRLGEITREEFDRIMHEED